MCAERHAVDAFTRHAGEDARRSHVYAVHDDVAARYAFTHTEVIDSSTPLITPRAR